MLEDSLADGLLLWLVLSLTLLLLVLVVTRLSSIIAFKRAQNWLADDKTLIHEYAASTDLTPAEFGFIFDRKLRESELIAILIELHQRDSIHLLPSKGDLEIAINPGKKITYRHDQMELELFSHLRKRQNLHTWNSLKKEFGTGGDTHGHLERLAYQSLEKKGYFVRGSYLSIHERIRNFNLYASAALSLLFVIFPLNESFRYSERILAGGYETVDHFVMSILIVFVAIGFWPLWYLYVSGVTSVIYHSSGIPFGATDKLKREWRRVYGYRVFLFVVERNRLNADPNLIDTVMPWAMAVGAGPKHTKLR